MSAPFTAVPLRGVILDMDGVLVDSEPFLKEAVVRMFASKGVGVKPEDVDPFIGTGEEHIIKGVAEKYGVSFEPGADKARAYSLYLELIRGRLQPLPGVYVFLAACRRRGLKLAVASSADAVKVAGNLSELKLSARDFDAIVNGSEVRRKKPAPDLFLRAAEELGLSPTVCLVVEDAVAGVAAAKAAGARCLALTTSFPAERLTAADWIAPNLARVPGEIFGERD